MPAIPIIQGVSAVAGAYSAVKGASDAKKAAQTAANAPAPTVNIPQLQQQAQNIAQQNAAQSALLEQQYNPGASQLRAGSLEALLGSLNPQNYSAVRNLAEGGAPQLAGPGQRQSLSGVAPRPGLSEIAARPAASAGNTELLNRVLAQAGQPLTSTGFESSLTRAAIEAAQRDLALGGQLPQDVRNLIARTAAGRSGAVSGGLGLGRDMTARDLGLTSLDVYNRRLQNAAEIGSQEAALEQANAAMRAQSEQFGRNNLLQSQQVFADEDARAAQNYAADAQIAAARDALVSNNYATDAQIAAQRDALLSQQYSTDAQLAAQRDALASSNYFNQAQLLEGLASGDFSRAFQAAQLGQNISQPASGLDPGSIANLAVGNTNAVAAQQQNAAALAAQAAQQRSALGGQLIGTAAGLYANRTPVAPKTSYSVTNLPTFNTPYTPTASYGLGSTYNFGKP